MLDRFSNEPCSEMIRRKSQLDMKETFSFDTKTILQHLIRENDVKCCRLNKKSILEISIDCIAKLLQGIFFFYRIFELKKNGVKLS